MIARTSLALFLFVPLMGCDKTVIIATDQLCQSWRHQTVSKGDKLTDKTAAGIEGNNEARPAWGCKAGENRAS